MWMKQGLLLLFIIVVINCQTIEHRIIQCYSCSDCANTTLIDINQITTVHADDQCMKTTIYSKSTGRERFVARGASRHCKDYSNHLLSITCCTTNLCNA